MGKNPALPLWGKKTIPSIPKNVPFYLIDKSARAGVFTLVVDVSQ